MTQVLDYEGLQKYDELLKDYIRSGEGIESIPFSEIEDILEGRFEHTEEEPTEEEIVEDHNTNEN
jgi:hypothetical protein